MLKKRSIGTVYITAVFAAAALFGAPSAGPLIAEAADGSPKITVDNSVFDFGAIAQGAPVEHLFTINNAGSDPLKIERLNPSCGCTAASLSAQIIDPGNSATIRTVFDTTGFQGYKVKTVRVYSNDPQQPSIVLTLKGSVIPDVVVDPPRIFFGNVKKGSAASITVTVAGSEQNTVKILDVDSRSSDLVLKVEDTKTDHGSGKKITVNLKEDLPVGTIRSRIAVKTSSEKNPVVQIPIFAKIVGEVQMVPADVSFGLIEGPLSLDAIQRVALESSAGHPVRILSAESDNPAVAVDANSPEDGSKNELLVRLKQGTSGMIRALVTVVTDHPDPTQNKLTLPVYAIVTKKGA